MITKEELSKLVSHHFPYTTPFKDQLETIQSICEAFIFRNKYHVILDAPTGSGKSVIAWTVMNVLREVGLINRTTTVTTTKALQHLYTDSFPDMFPLKAKGNYTCPYDRGPYLSPECRIHTKLYGCKPKRSCPYVLDREKWCDQAIFRNTNTAFMLEACGSLVLNEGRFSDFMVIDEAHRLEELVIEHSRCVFNSKVISDVDAINMFLGGNKVHELIIKMLTLFKQKSSLSNENILNYSPELRSICSKLNNELEEFSAKINDYIGKLDPQDNEDNRSIEYLTQSLEEINNMSDYSRILCNLKDDVRMHVWIDQNYLEIKIIDAKVTSYESLFRKSRRFLHMSGTICGFEYHVDKLGLKPEECEFIKVPNHIPIKNRTISALGNFRIRSNSYEGNAKAILYTDRILDHFYNQHGFIYCPSYEMCETYLKYSENSHRLRIPENLDEAREILSKDGNEVIISPAIIEGIDLKGDMCRFQIIPRIPYLYLGDDIVRVKLDTEPEFYYRTTIMKLVQVCGRGVRGINDYCETYIFDPTIKQLVTKNLQYVPDWFFDAIKFYF